MPAPKKYPDELRERAVRLVFESNRPIAAVARDLAIHRDGLRLWVRRAEADAGARGDLLNDQRARAAEDARAREPKAPQGRRGVIRQ